MPNQFDSTSLEELAIDQLENFETDQFDAEEMTSESQEQLDDIGLGEPHEMMASLIQPAKKSESKPTSTTEIKKLKRPAKVDATTQPPAKLSPAAASVSAAAVPAIPTKSKPKKLNLSAVQVSKPTQPSHPEQQPKQLASAAETTSAPEPTEVRTFDDLPLSPQVLRAVKNSGYESPTPIQAEIIPHMLAGRDILAQSQTGTGKTAAFALPILSNIQLDAQRLPKTLILAPTRELAIQVAKSFETYAEDMRGFNVTAIYGGQDYEIQFRQLKRGAHVVVGTPGRVIDHINRGTLDLSGIETLVLDEADEMLNMGFLEDVQFVLEKTPENRQIALFSATLPGPVREIAEEYLNDPTKITIKKKTMTADSIRQRALFVSPREKLDALCRFLEVEDTDGVIVFTKTKDSTIAVAEALNREGHAAIALNGDMPQKVRERAIDQLKSSQLNVLVATDVAARGLDVKRVSHVFNFDLPHDSESYIHRVGRTGRAGRAGEAIIFLTPSQRGKLKLIERATKQSIEVVDVPSADDINSKRVERFQNKITEVISQRDLTLYKNLIAQFAESSAKPLELVAAALADMANQGRSFFVKDQPKRSRRERESGSENSFREGKSRDRRRENSFGEFAGDSEFGGKRRAKAGGRELGPPEPGMKRFRVEVGRRDGVRPANLVGAIANEAGIDGQFIGPIKIMDSFSTIDLPADIPADLFQTIKNTWVVGKQLKLSSFSNNRPQQQSSYHQRAGQSERGTSHFGNKQSRKSSNKFSNEGGNFGDAGNSERPKSKGPKTKGNKPFGPKPNGFKGKSKKRKDKN